MRAAGIYMLAIYTISAAINGKRTHCASFVSGWGE
jgi:hypothetical protein